MWLVGFAVSVLFVPVKYAPYERGNEGDFSLSTRHRLGEGEQQGHVAVDAIFLLQVPESYITHTLK